MRTHMSFSPFAFTTGVDMIVVASPSGVQLWGLGPSKDSRSWVHDVALPSVPGDSATGDLWTLPVQAVTVAGDMPVVAVVLDSSDTSSVGAADEEGNRMVHLFDGTTGVHMAELYFRGAAIRALFANSDILVVAMEDGLHLVDILTLAHVRYEPTVHPLNPLAVVALSAMPRSAHRPAAEGEVTYCVAYPHDAASSPGAFPHGIRLLAATFSVASARTTATAAAEGRLSFVRHEVGLHARPVGRVSFNLDGTLVATASVEGSTVKVVDTQSLVILHTLQRSNTARGAVYGLAFNFSATMLAALSYSGTVHIFHLSAPGRARNRSGAGTGRPRAFEKKTVSPLTIADTSCPDGSDGALSLGFVPPSLTCHYGLTFSMDDQHIWVAQSSAPAGSRRVAVLRRFAVADRRVDPVEVFTLFPSATV